MSTRTLISIILGFTFVVPSVSVQAQNLVVASSGIDDETINYYRPQIAAAPDGSFAVAWEALIQGEFYTKWHVGVQRYSPAGVPIGQPHYFQPEIGCSALDTWLSDDQHNVELAFASTGLLLVLMQHSGEYDIITTSEWSSEITLGVIDQNGAANDLNLSKPNCEQWKFIFPGADEQDRPRMALMPNNALLLTMDGFFGQSDLRNVGVDIYDANLNDLVQGELIPHLDPASLQAFHMWPDIATSGELVVTVWHECPIIDPQGNADECDIAAQFSRILPTEVQIVGTNVVVNAGDPQGTLNWRPSVAMNPAGASVVVWQDFRTGTQGEVFGQMFDNAGQKVGPNFQISEGTGALEIRPEVRPEVAMLNDGQFMVVWADTSSAGYQARGRQYAPNGVPLGSAFLLDETPGIETGIPSVASNGTNYYFITLGRASNGDLSLLATAPTSNTANERQLPDKRDLAFDVYPNPFAGEATIQFELADPTSVRVILYDMIGRQVGVLVDKPMGAGQHSVSLDGASLAPGVYLAQVRYGEGQEVQVVVRAR